MASASIVRTPAQILGVTPDAPLTLAESIYWKRAHALTEAVRRGDAGARERLEELNAAQALLRETFKAEAAPEPALEDQPRRGLAIAVFGGALLCAGIAAAVSGPAAGIVILAVGTLGAMALSMHAAPVSRSDEESQRDALALLYLVPGASAEEVKIAYEILRDSTLAGGSDRDAAVLARLRRLQSAYQAALPSGGAPIG